MSTEELAISSFVTFFRILFIYVLNSISRSFCCLHSEILTSLWLLLLPLRWEQHTEESILSSPVWWRFRSILDMWTDDELDTSWFICASKWIWTIKWWNVRECNQPGALKQAAKRDATESLEWQPPRSRRLWPKKQDFIIR